MSRKFNLQPWRAEKRALQKKNFIATTMLIAILIAGALMAERWLQLRIVEKQEAALELLNKDIARFNRAKAEVERLDTLNKEVNLQIGVIQELQSKRGLTVEMLDYIAQHTPESIFLTEISYSGTELGFRGIANNDTGVSEFMREMSGFKNFAVPQLRSIQSATSTDRFTVSEDSEVKSFHVVVQVRYTEGGA